MLTDLADWWAVLATGSAPVHVDGGMLLGIAMAAAMVALVAAIGWWVTRRAAEEMVRAVAPDRPTRSPRIAIVSAIIWGAFAVASLILGILRALGS